MDLSKEIKKDNKIKYNFYRESTQTFFVYSLISYLLYYLIESLFSGFITNFYNLNYHLSLVIILGVLSVIFEPKKEEEIVKSKNDKFKKTFEYLFVFVVSIISIFLIYYKIKEISSMAYLISILSGLVILLLSLYILFEDQKKDN